MSTAGPQKPPEPVVKTAVPPSDTKTESQQQQSSGGSGFSFASLLGFGGHSIKTHEPGESDPHLSHPELALSPTDVGIWTERNSFHEKRPQEQQK